MKKAIVIPIFLFIVVLGIFVVRKKEKMPTVMPGSFNFIIAYGYSAKNKIDTFKCEYTKDLVMDGSATCKLIFTDEEMKEIYQEMQKINILSYPRYFNPPYMDNPEPGITASEEPFSTYYFKVQVGSKVKEINWVDKNGSQARAAVKLNNLITKIMKIIETKEEYKKLPQPKGAYA